MKEVTGEVSMTVITIVAIAVIGGIIALFWKPIKATIAETFGGSTQSACENMTGDGMSCSWVNDKCDCTVTD